MNRTERVAEEQHNDARGRVARAERSGVGGRSGSRHRRRRRRPDRPRRHEDGPRRRKERDEAEWRKEHSDGRANLSWGRGARLGRLLVEWIRCRNRVEESEGIWGGEIRSRGGRGEEVEDGDDASSERTKALCVRERAR